MMNAIYKNRPIQFDGDKVYFTDDLPQEMTVDECNEAFDLFESELAEQSHSFRAGYYEWRE